MSDARRLVLSLSKISKAFPGVKALDLVDLQVYAGEIHGLVGENGAGKSTLMGVASGALTADEGELLVMGTKVSGEPDRIRDLGLAIVRQEPLLLPDLTVAENIYLGLPHHVRPALSDLKRFAADALSNWSDDAGIDVDSRVETLNPEKRFIVEIVKALAGDVKVLVLDEPTEHLAAEDVERLFARIRSLVAKGAAVIYISHRIKEVQAVASRLTVLRDGKSIGTHDAVGLTEDDIVTMIVGAALEEEFPPKRSEAASAVVLKIDSFSGPGFHQISLELSRGEIVGLAGIDANGQREFLRSLAGLTPGSGQITLNGQKIEVRTPSDAMARGVSFLPGDRHREGIAAGLTVRENFTMRSLARDLVGPFIRRKSEEDRTSRAVSEYAVRTPSNETIIGALSGGNQQKLVLASVLASAPRVLLIEEPTQGVDVGARVEIYRTLRRVAESGIAILVVSSDATEISGLCDRVMIFSRGAIVERLEGVAVTENAITGAVLRATSTRQRSAARLSNFIRWASGDSAPTVMVGTAVVAMGVVASFLNHTYLTPLGLAGMMTLAATLALVAYGQQLLMLVGGIDLSVGPLMGLAGVVGSFFLGADAGSTMHAAGWIAILATAAAVGLFNFALIEVIRLHPLIATLATYMGLQAVSLILRPLPDGMTDFDILDALGAKVGFVPVTFVLTVAAGLLLEFVLFHRRLGIALRGFGSRPEVARMIGLSSVRMRLLSYVGCSVFAGLAGIALIQQVGTGDARAGLGYTLTSIAAAVIGGASLFGGRGSFVGALMGSILIVQINQVASFVRLDTAWTAYLMGAMILLAVALYSTSRKMALPT